MLGWRWGWVKRGHTTIISRCNSPIPAISVCPVSSLVVTLNEGSSCISFPRDCPSFS